MDEIDLAIESLKTHIEYDKKAMNTGTINISMAEAENILKLLKEYKRKDGCPCTHCMEWECDEVCEEYKKWKDT